MSAPATSAQNLDPNPPKSDPDRLARPVGVPSRAGLLPPDPLLRSGSFIDASTATSNGGGPFDDRKAQKLPPHTPEPRRSSGGSPAPSSESTARGKRKPTEAELDWLPPGWTVEDRVRTSGATAGTRDRVFLRFDNDSGFLNELLFLISLLAYGISTILIRCRAANFGRRKRFSTFWKQEVEKKPMDSSGEQKQNASTNIKGSALNFNFSSVPEKVQWVLADSSGESWNALIGDKQVPESSKRDWLAAFTFLASRDRGRYH
ncbi:hypothetical protein TIFTF001_000451 [Ficus carica]|uniref:Uncharacterized protein n=1 Tax=Ficus carica TaxID=3494 RepID=A0AA88CJZ6_FICCA|nr:hypothetical protein TIFTF001_000451 [Ficus carica]